ncbi:hypothetical protein GCM10010234_79650 [Streptomyces hawaiiensis]
MCNRPGRRPCPTRSPTPPSGNSPGSSRNPQIPQRHNAERSENIVRWTEFDRGGHFAAMEQPDLLVGDVRAFFRQLREKD